MDNEKEITLDKLKPGEKGVVVKILKKGNFTRRILDVGIHPGCEIEVERVAPLGDPIEFKLKGCHISLRKQEAESIIVNPTGESQSHDNPCS